MPAAVRKAKPANKRPDASGFVRPRMAKADGEAAVRAYIAKLPGWRREFAQRFDDLVARHAPEARRAVKWNNPIYGIEGRGWFAAFAAFKSHVKLAFFKGTSLKPVPPNGESHEMRSLDLTEADTFDDKLIGSWIRQAAKLPGWGS